jgi:hypothetical protein
MKRLLIIKVPDFCGNRYDRPSIGLTMPTRAIAEANMVILKTPTHFRCVKNRWDADGDDEKIPNFLLKTFLMKYADNFTAEELIDSLL